MRTIMLVAICAVVIARVARGAEFTHSFPEHDQWTVRLWYADPQPVIYGLVVVGDGGPIAVISPQVRALAAHYGFGVLGTDGDRPNSAEMVLRACKALAEATGHPELVHAPFVAFGNSNGGRLSFKLVCAAPERAIAFADLVYARYQDDVPEAALVVPGLFAGGQFDSASRNIGARELVLGYRPKGARWAYYLEQGTGHTGETRRMYDYVLPFVAQMVERRYPKGASPADGPVALLTIAESEGWLVDTDRLGEGMARLDTFGDYDGDRARAGWVPNRDLAYLFRAAASYDRPLNINADKTNVRTPTDYEWMNYRSDAKVFAPGEEVVLSIDSYAAPHWERLELYEGAELVDVGAYGPTGRGPTEFTATPPAGVHSYSVVGRSANGESHVSPPIRVLVMGGPGIPHRAEGGAPVVLAQTESVSAGEGGKVEMTALVDGGGLVKYGWEHDGERVAGATSNTLVLTNVTKEDTGSYVAAATNGEGQAQTEPIALEVTPFAGTTAAFTREPPAMDGVVGGVWDAAGTVELTRVVKGEIDEDGDERARLRALWDQRNLYLQVDVDDATPTAKAEDVWSNDLVEVFLEGSNEKGVLYGPNDYQFVVPRHGEELVEIFHQVIPKGVKWAVMERQEGCVVELAVPFLVLGRSPEAGDFVGMDCMADFKGSGKKAWHVDTDRAWVQPGYLGAVRLGK